MCSLTQLPPSDEFRMRMTPHNNQVKKRLLNERGAI